MAIKYSGYAEQDTITVGSNQIAIVDGGAEIDTIKITADQTADVDANQDATAVIALQAGVGIASATTLFGTQIVTLSNGATIKANAGATFTIGTQTVTMAELGALTLPYSVTGTEAPVSTNDIMANDNSTGNLVGTAYNLDASAAFTGTGVTDFEDYTLTINTADTVTNGTNDVDVDFDGTNVTTAANLVYVDSTVIGTFTVNADDTTTTVNDTITVTLNAAATEANIQTLLQNIKMTNTDTGTDGVVETVTVTLKDNATTPNTVITDSIDVEFLDGALAFTNVDDESTLTTIAETAAAIVDSATTNFEASTGLMNGTTLTIAITAGANAADDLLIVGADGAENTLGGARNADGYLLVDDNTADDGVVGYIGDTETNIGTIVDSGTAFDITFNAAATDTLVNKFLQNLSFDTTAGDGERTITYTFTTTEGTVSTATSTVSVSSSEIDLTTGNDVDPEATGTAGVDVFTAASGELNAGDVLDGGEGTDRLIVTMNGSAAIAPTLTSIEIIDVVSATAGNGIDFVNVTGATRLNVEGTQNATMTNVNSTMTRIDATDMTAGDLTVNMTTDDNGDIQIDGGITAALLSIDMKNTLDASDDINATASITGDTLVATINALDAATTGKLNISNIETITLTTATAASTIDASGIVGDAAANSIALLGDQDITITNLDSSITALDASGTFTGNLNVTIDDTTVTDATAETASAAVIATNVFTGDAGDDVFNLGTGMTQGHAADASGDTAAANVALTAVDGATADVGDSIVGGAGDDTLNATISMDMGVDATTNTTATVIASVENVNFTVALVNEGNSATYTGSDADTITANTLDDKTLTISGDLIASGITTLTLDGGATGEAVHIDDATLIASSDFTLTATDLTSDLTVDFTAANTDDNVEAMTVTGGTGSDTVNVLLGAIDNASAETPTLTTTNVENVVIESGADSSVIDLDGVNGADIAITNVAFDLTITNASGNVTASTGSNDAADQLVVVTANAAMAYTGNDVTETINGSDSADSFTFNSVDADGEVTTATTMADSFSDADTINGALGTDSLTAAISGATIAPDVDNVESITLSLSAGTTIDASEITHDTAASTSITLTGAGSSTISNVGAAVASIDSSALSSSQIYINATDLGGDQSADRTLELTATGARDKFYIDGNELALGTVTINDFNAGSGVFADLLDLTAYGYSDTDDISILQSGANTVISAISANGTETFSIVLADVSAAELDTTRNFTFSGGTDVTVVDVITTADLGASNFGAANTAALATTTEALVISGAVTLTASSTAEFSNVVTVKGLTGNQTLELDAAAAYDLSGISVSGVELLTLAAGTTLTADEDDLADVVSVIGTSATTDIVTVTVDSDNDMDLSGIAVTTASFVINGNANANTITGTAGVDTITGGDGADTIDGGAGADVIVYTAAGETATATTWTDTEAGSTVSVATADIITYGTGDTIDLTSIDGTVAGYATDTEVDTLVTDASALGVADQLVYYTGNYDSTTGLFTSAADGDASDILVVIEDNDDTSVSTYEMIVVTGVSNAVDTAGVLSFT